MKSKGGGVCGQGVILQDHTTQGALPAAGGPNALGHGWCGESNSHKSIMTPAPTAADTDSASSCRPPTHRPLLVPVAAKGAALPQPVLNLLPRPDVCHAVHAGHHRLLHQLAVHQPPAAPAPGVAWGGGGREGGGKGVVRAAGGRWSAGGGQVARQVLVCCLHMMNT